jgi:hypothetical protein
MQAHYRDHGKYHFARSVLVLHNVAHQGRGPMDDLRLLEVPEQYKELFRWAVQMSGAVQAAVWLGGRHRWQQGLPQRRRAAAAAAAVWSLLVVGGACWLFCWTHLGKFIIF